MIMDKEELVLITKKFEGFCEGFEHGSKMEEPNIFIQVRSALYDFQRVLNQSTDDK